MSTSARPFRLLALSPNGRGRLLRIVGWLALALALGATFRAYLDPNLALDLGSFMQMCGFR
jgi:hypothetical protein